MGHFAMGVSFDDLRGIVERMKTAGVTPLDFDARPASDLVVLAWMPAAAIYFQDPDGHSLEYISMLPEDARPELGVLNYKDWEKKR
jgi:catechol 2,3-dioxygenase-like lactoylglutathione lyase family enzyme